MKRRTFLSVIGAMAAAPNLLIADQVISDRAGGSIFTGFPTLDLQMGGLKSGEMYGIIGNAGAGKSAMSRSIAINASKGHRVAYIPEYEGMFCNAAGDLVFDKFNGNLLVYPDSSKSIWSWESLESVIAGNDLVIFEEPPMSPMQLYTGRLQQWRKDVGQRLLILAKLYHTSICICFYTNDWHPTQLAADNLLSYVPTGSDPRNLVMEECLTGCIQMSCAMRTEVTPDGFFLMFRGDRGFSCHYTKEGDGIPSNLGNLRWRNLRFFNTIDLSLRPNLTFFEAT